MSQREREQATAGKPRWRRVSAIAIGLVISGGFVWLLLTKIELARIGQIIARIDLTTLCLAGFSLLGGFLMMTARSAALLGSVAHYDFYTLFKSVMVGFAANNVLPLRAGELLRIDYLARHGSAAHSSCLAIVAVERLLDLMWLMLLTVAAAPLAVVKLPRAPMLLGLGLAILLALGMLALIAKRPELFITICGRFARLGGKRTHAVVEQKARVFASGLASLQSPWRALAAAGFTGLYWATTLVTIYITQRAFGLPLPWYAPLIVIIFSAFAVVIPSSPAYLGTYHAFVTFGMTSLGVANDSALSFAIVLHAVGTLPFTLVSLVLLVGELAARAKPEAN